MFRAAVVTIALAFVSTASAQETAALDPTATTPAAINIPDVVKQCELVAAAEEGSTGIAGACVGSTQTFIDGLTGRDSASVDQAITDLVVAIAPLVQDETCNWADEEIAQAIRLASTKASTPEQIAQLAEIADTVAACDNASTAEIAPEEIPASAA